MDVIADDMIKDITSLLAMMAAKQPKKVVIRSSSSSFKMGITTTSWNPSAWGRGSSSSPQDDVGTSSYLSSVIRSTKIGNFRWPQVESKESGQEKEFSHVHVKLLTKKFSHVLKVLNPAVGKDELKDISRSGARESSESTVHVETEDRKMKTTNYWYSLGKEISIAQAKRNVKTSKIANRKKEVVPELEGLSRKKEGEKVEMQDNGVNWGELKRTS